MKKRLVSILCFVIALCVLAGCADRTKSEKEIRADLEVNAEFFESIGNQSISIDSIAILKRQTNKKEKTDYVYVDIDAQNENVILHASYKLKYGLYNDGWLLDRVIPESRETWMAKAKKGMDVEQCIAHWLEYNDRDYMPVNDSHENYQISSIEFDEEKQECHVSWKDTHTHGYEIKESTADYYYRFNPRELDWDLFDHSWGEYDYEWDIEGTWFYESEVSFEHCPEMRNDAVSIKKNSDHFNIKVTRSIYDYVEHWPRSEWVYKGTFEDEGIIPLNLPSGEIYIFGAYWIKLEPDGIRMGLKDRSMDGYKYQRISPN